MVALDDRKAVDPVILDVRGISSITDFLVIVTANSEPHMKALINTAQKELKGLGGLVRTDFNAGSGWAVIDAFDFMVHIFTAEQREVYRLESLWRDARSVGVDSVTEGMKPLPQGTEEASE